MSDDTFPEIPQPAPAEAPPPVAEEPPPAPEEPPKPAEEEKVHELPKGVQRRIDRAVRAKYEAEARAQAAEEQLNYFRQRETGQREQPASHETEPTIDKFDNIEHYVAAKAQWIARQEVAQAFQANQRQAQQFTEAQQHAQVREQWAARLQAATAEMPDFEDVVATADVPMSRAMEQAILESEIGPKMAYWLAQHPQEAVNISRLPPSKAFTQLGRIEERLLAGKTVTPKLTSAPPPVQPVSTRSSVSKNPDDMSTEQWMKWRRDQIAKR
jgi:hypothetical protein